MIPMEPAPIRPMPRTEQIAPPLAAAPIRPAPSAPMPMPMPVPVPIVSQHVTSKQAERAAPPFKKSTRPSANPVAALNSAAQQLSRELEGSKTNIERFKIIFASDARLSKVLPNSIEASTWVQFIEKPLTISTAQIGNVFETLFGSSKVPEAKQELKVLDQVLFSTRMRFAGTNDSVVIAAIAYGRARGEPFSLSVQTKNTNRRIELASLNIIGGTLQSFDTAKGSSEEVFIVSPAPGNLVLQTSTGVAKVSTSTTASRVAVTPSPSSTPVTVAATDDLCSDAANFILKGFCQTKKCSTEPELASHPVCMRQKQMQDNRNNMGGN